MLTITAVLYWIRAIVYSKNNFSMFFSVHWFGYLHRSRYVHAHIPMLYKRNSIFFPLFICVVFIPFGEKLNVQSSFLRTEKSKYIKTLPYNSPWFFLYIVHFAFIIKHSIFINSDGRQFKNTRRSRVWWISWNARPGPVTLKQLRISF